MAFVTLQIVEGFERGMIFRRLATPVSIGRERENDVQLNDEQVSRFHAKIQDADGKLILTDLDSTNGIRVNGRPVKVRVLQVGDQLTMGRSVLVFGSPEELSRRRASSNGTEDDAPAGTVATNGDEESDLVEEMPLAQRELRKTVQPELEPGPQPLFRTGPPDLPRDLRPAQRAELSDVMAYIHDQLSGISLQGKEDHQQPQYILLPWTEWHRLLQLAMTTARYLRDVADPGASRDAAEDSEN